MDCGRMDQISIRKRKKLDNKIGEGQVEEKEHDDEKQEESWSFWKWLFPPKTEEEPINSEHSMWHQTSTKKHLTRPH